jgi:hypothetical protein
MQAQYSNTLIQERLGTISNPLQQSKRCWRHVVEIELLWLRVWDEAQALIFYFSRNGSRLGISFHPALAVLGTKALLRLEIFTSTQNQQ